MTRSPGSGDFAPERRANCGPSRPKPAPSAVIQVWRPAGLPRGHHAKEAQHEGAVCELHHCPCPPYQSCRPVKRSRRTLGKPPTTSPLSIRRPMNPCWVRSLGANPLTNPSLARHLSRVRGPIGHTNRQERSNDRKPDHDQSNWPSKVAKYRPREKVADSDHNKTKADGNHNGCRLGMASSPRLLIATRCGSSHPHQAVRLQHSDGPKKRGPRKCCTDQNNRPVHAYQPFDIARLNFYLEEPSS